MIRTAATAFALTLLASTLPALAQETSVAVADFDYLDTSGEPRDQTAEHAARLRLFRTTLAETLEANGPYRIVALACAAQNCSTGSFTPDELVAEAKDAGAELLILGGIHKISTLIGSGRVDVVDVGDSEVVLTRSISFRGDNDEAFRHAAEFTGESIVAALPGAQPQAGSPPDAADGSPSIPQ